MSFSISMAVVACPECGMILMPIEKRFGNDPELLSMQCEKCGSLVEVRRGADGKWGKKVVQAS